MVAWAMMGHVFVAVMGGVLQYCGANSWWEGSMAQHEAEPEQEMIVVLRAAKETNREVAPPTPPAEMGGPSVAGKGRVPPP